MTPTLEEVAWNRYLVLEFVELLVGVSPDLRRFLLLETEPLPNPAPLRVLTSWQERLKAR